MTTSGATGMLSALMDARATYFARRKALAWPVKLWLACGLAILTGVSAQVVIPLPFTPVPITGQVFAVLLAGIALGGRWGAASQGIYVGAGTLGMPWFAGGTSGLPVWASGGYLIGFVAAAYVIGTLNERHERMRTLAGQLVSMAMGIGVIYAFGAAQFAIVMHANAAQVWTGAIMPFIAVDAVKALAAAGVARVIQPRKLPS
ncbi:MAG: biotin transporter BioY [Planctomycetota bacterium]